MAHILLYFCLSVIFSACFCYEFLLVSPVPSRSHSVLGEGILRILLNGGHKVTYVTAFPINGTSIPNLRQIDVSSIKSLYPEEKRNIKSRLEKKSAIVQVYEVNTIFDAIANAVVNHKNVQKLLLNETEKFDGIVAEWMFSEYYAGFAALYRSPLIWIVPLYFQNMALSMLGEHALFASTETMVSDSSGSLLERIHRLAIYSFEQLLQWKSYDTERKKYMEAFSPGSVKRAQALPPYDDIRYNASMTLSNSHVSLGIFDRLPHNYKQIAGYHIADKIPPLPENLHKIMDTAKNGVIYFSMGSVLKSKYFPENMKKGLVTVFDELNHTVIWAFEGDDTNFPKNVHTIPWAPQQSILAHPNCLLFITHGGILSVIEALHFGVPIIGIPIFGDQFVNIDRAVKNGYAKQYELNSSPKKLKEIIEDMVRNPRYRQEAKEHSLVFHHRPVPPAKEVLHWIEHVVLTRGAPHLRPVGRGVPLYQKLYLDLVALIIVTLVVLLYGFKSIANKFKITNSIHLSDKKNV